MSLVTHILKKDLNDGGFFRPVLGSEVDDGVLVWTDVAAPDR